MLDEKDLSANQCKAVQFILEGADSLLFADMGVGKTVIVLTALAELFKRGEAKRVLVVAPMRVARWTWPQEVAKWRHLQHLSVAVASGEPGKPMHARTRKKALAENAQITTINYESLRWLLEQHRFRQPQRGGIVWIDEPWPFDAIVFDEPDKMKRTSKRFKEIKRYLPHISTRIAAAGTPTPNTLAEIWAVAYLVDIGRTFFTSYSKFEKKYLYPENPYMGRTSKMLVFPHLEQEIYDKLDPFTFRIALEDEVDMPPHREVIVPVKLNAEAGKIYADMEKKFVAWVQENERTVTAVTAGAKIQKLTQIAAGFLYTKEEDDLVRYAETTWLDHGKIDALAETVEGLGGKQLIVVYNYKAQREALRERFGDQIWELNDETMRRWNAGEGSLLMIHPKSAGHGLNLHEGGCHHVAFLTSPWSGGDDAQTIARVRRRNQKHPVVVLRYTAMGTIDERILEVLRGKKQGMAALLDAMLEKTKERE